MTSLTDLEAVESLLADFGIRHGSPEQQSELATRLVSEGMTTDVADTLRDWWAELEKDAGVTAIGRIVGAALSRKDKWESVLTSARRVLNRRQEQQASEPERNHMEPPPKEPDAEEEDRCAWIYCRLVFDRYPLAEVCAEQHLTEREVKDKARQGSRQYGHDPDTDDRLRCALDSEFREQWLKEKRAWLESVDAAIQPQTKGEA